MASGQPIPDAEGATPMNDRVATLGLLTAVAAFTVDVSLPAVPAMVEALATNLSRGQKIVGIFMFGMAFGQIPAGLVSDRVGRLPVIYAGMALFLVGAVAASMANSIEVMLAGIAFGLGQPMKPMQLLWINLVTDGLPIVYRQQRLGRFGREFTLYKFRTMPIDAEATTGPVWASSGEGRATPFGSFLRRSSISSGPMSMYGSPSNTWP